MDAKNSRAHVWRIPAARIPLKGYDEMVTGMMVHFPTKERERLKGKAQREAYGPETKRGGPGMPNGSLWTMNFHTAYPLTDADRPPVPWPEELKRCIF